LLVAEMSIRMHWVLHGEMKFKDLFKKWWSPIKTWKYQGVKILASVSDIPQGSLGRDIYLVSRDGKNRWVIFDCPKGHGKRIEVNLMQSVKPFWDISMDNGKISLYPSVAVSAKNCSCHFWLKQNVAQEAFFLTD